MSKFDKQGDNGNSVHIERIVKRLAAFGLVTEPDHQGGRGLTPKGKKFATPEMMAKANRNNRMARKPLPWFEICTIDYNDALNDVLKVVHARFPSYAAALPEAVRIHRETGLYTQIDCGNEDDSVWDSCNGPYEEVIRQAATSFGVFVGKRLHRTFDDPVAASAEVKRLVMAGKKKVAVGYDREVWDWVDNQLVKKTTQ